jgi:hypothetical protein
MDSRPINLRFLSTGVRVYMDHSNLKIVFHGLGRTLAAHREEEGRPLVLAIAGATNSSS